MKNSLAILSILLISIAASAQGNCYTKLEEAFKKRGSYTVADDIHRNVIISFVTDKDTTCVYGKARVENGAMVNIFLQFEDNTYEIYEKKFYNANKMTPIITNGMSELIYTIDGEVFKVFFIDRMKPKQKSYKEVTLPDDL
jgi:hypothetical protein